MRILFICASVDVKNAVVGDTLDRAETLARHEKVASLSILSLHGEGEWQERGLRVYGVGSDRNGRLKTLLLFFKVLAKAVRKENPDLFYLYMCPTLAPLLFVFRFFKGIKIVQWFGHAVYTRPTRWSLTYFSDLWFNSNRSMAPFPVKHLHLVGQGVKADQFSYDPSAEKQIDLITIGRISPIKKIDQMLDVLKLCRDKYGKKYRLRICGDAFVPSDIAYKERLEKTVRRYGLEGQVEFAGMISRKDLPVQIRKAKVFLFLVNGGVGKATLECLASGLPVLISTPEASDFFGDELSKWFLCTKDDDDIARSLIRILELPKEDYQELALKAHQLFLNRYTMEKFIDRIVRIVDVHL